MHTRTSLAALLCLTGIGPVGAQQDAPAKFAPDETLRLRFRGRPE